MNDTADMCENRKSVCLTILRIAQFFPIEIFNDIGRAILNAIDKVVEVFVSYTAPHRNTERTYIAQVDIPYANNCLILSLTPDT